MNKRLILVLALAFVVGIAFAAYAEVQNVKVGGDLTVYGVSRHNYSVDKPYGAKTVTIGGDANKSSRDNYMSIIRLKVDADLTDNVAATVRLINERDWKGLGTTGQGSTTDQSAIDLDLAYVTLKEFLYSPLTLKVGRQELRIGSALVIGSGTNTDVSGLLEDDLTSRKAFDAIVATLDYNPLTLVLGTAKLAETTQITTDDTEAYVMDAVYKFKDYNAVADVSYVMVYGASYPIVKGRHTDVIDLRLTADPIKNLSVELEYARQFGQYLTTTTEDNAGWALTAGAKYSLADIKQIAKYAPVLGLKYDYRSGEKVNPTTKSYKAWQPLYEDQVNGVIYDPNTNISIINVSGDMKLMEDVILAANYYNYKFAQRPAIADTSPYTGKKHNKNAGDELDLNLTYNYTEDVSFGLLGGIFWPGAAYDSQHEKNATEILGSMKVTF